MYKNNKFSGGGSSSGFSPKRGGRPFFRRGPSRRGGRTENISHSRFINKAEAVEQKEYESTNSFESFPISQGLKKSISEKGFSAPTPIQDQSIPHILEGKDMVGIANTGTGKTASFLIPLIHKMENKRSEKALIIVPTRELAIQIDEEFKALSKGLSMFSVCTVGGLPIGKQIVDLRRIYNVVIGTPGRLKDLIERKCIKLSDFNSVVLDEADRMLDMGFIGDMRFVMAGMPKDRQTLFFSATLSPDIQKIITEFLTDPVHVSVKTRDTSKAVDQDIVKVPEGQDKIEVLHKLLQGEEFNKVLIFGETKFGVERLSKKLNQRGLLSASIHGNKNHAQRQRALALFKDHKVQILVATDVAARGLDIPNVSHVINYDIPKTHDDYVHRIGRTGRGGKTGKALTFVN